MCGICGELRFDQAVPDMEALKRMTAKLARRGPDHEGFFNGGALAFGHRRLSIIDLSSHADQPMVDDDLRLALVFNGTIYNYKELRAELMEMGYEFFSDGDTEVILKAYHAWGENCVQRFYGMFAFALWDMRDKSLFLARDRFGIKPLYYALDGVRLRFASTMQALLAGGRGRYQHRSGRVASPLHSAQRGARAAHHAGRHQETAACTYDEIHRVRRGELQRYWSLDATRPAGHTVRTGLDRGDAHRDDACSGTASSGFRCAGRRAAFRRAGFEPAGRAAGRSCGRPELPSPSASRMWRANGQRVRVFRSDGGTFQHAPSQVRHPQHEVLKRLPEAIAQMSEPMPSYDVTAFYLLGRAGARKR